MMLTDEDLECGKNAIYKAIPDASVDLEGESNTSSQNGLFIFMIEKSNAVNQTIKITDNISIRYEKNKIIGEDNNFLIQIAFAPLNMSSLDYEVDNDNSDVFIIRGVKITDGRENELICTPIEDTVTIQYFSGNPNMYNGNGYKKETFNLDKNKKYLLPLEKQRIKSILSREISMEEYEENEVIKTKRDNKSLCGLGCINGDEKSCCGCLYW